MSFSNSGETFQNRRMLPGDGYQQYDGGPGNNVHGQQIPAGSRLNQYLSGGQSGQRLGTSFGLGTPINVNAPAFIPKHQQKPPPPPPQQSPLTNQFAQMAIHDVPQQIIPYSQAHSLSFGGPLPHHRPHPHHSPQIHHPPPQAPFNQYQLESRGGTTYFYPEDHQQPPHDKNQFEEQAMPDGVIPVNTSGCFVYNTPLPIAHVARFRGKANANQQTQFISPELRIELLQRQLAFETKVDPTAYTDIPSAVEHYSNLVPLENVAIQNQPQTTFKAFSCRDGGFYCLRRIHGYAVTHPGKQTFPAEQWKKLAHVNIVPLRELLINCRAFGDSSLVFVYDYYPLAVTLMSKHFEPKSATFYDAANGFRLSSTVHMPPPLGTAASENMLWSYLIQITAALRAIHTNGLACRAVDLNKIIVYGNKIMLSFCGIQDIVNQDQQAIQTLQFEDLNQLGNLMVALASGRSHGYRKDLLQGTMKTIMETYSIDFKAVVTYLTNANNPRKTISELMPLIGGRFFTVIENMQAKTDVMEAELSKELENGRLFRLLTKMNTVLERVEHASDENWSETGDRFMLKLFRDYVFHQNTEHGKAWLDMAHIVQCLNKLDSGSLEKIEMVSRSGDTQIIIDYNQLKKCLEKSFRELAGAPPLAMLQRH